jgi:hypothetical protein
MNKIWYKPLILCGYLKKPLLFALLLMLNACSKIAETVPDDKDLIYQGEWAGNTSQMKMLELEVQEINAAARIVSIRLGYIDNDEYNLINITDKSGLAGIDSGAFQIVLPNQWKIEGVFSDEQTCRGFLISGDKQSVKHSLLLKKLPADAGIYDIAQVNFDANSVNYNYRQQFNLVFPSADFQKSDTSYSISSSMNINGNNISGTKLITLRHNNISDPDDIRQIFSPGKKQFADSISPGFEIIFSNPGFYFETWSTTAENGDQSESELEIIDLIEMNTGNQTKVFKYAATFNCTVYRKWSTIIEIENGFMIGFVKVE